MNLINTFPDDISHLKHVIQKVVEAGMEHKKEHSGKNVSASVKLNHEYMRNRSPKFVAKLIYSVSTKNHDTTSVSNNEVKLEEGENYTYDALNELINGVLDASAQETSTNLAYGINPTADDIKDYAMNVFNSALQSVGIRWDVTAVIVVEGINISKFTVVIG